jgi:glycerol-3-phosphate dehydrogenase
MYKFADESPGMKFQNNLPTRVRLLILGGGIHGVGLLHDMVTRGWQDIHLVEKGRIGCGTSSKSTKLIHGGLRYLKQIRDFPLVFEALHERKLLMELAPDLVSPLELYLPVLKKGGTPGFILKAGLGLYDMLAGRSQIGHYKKVTREEAATKAPNLNQDILREVLSYWDGQTDDLQLTRRVAASAVNLGAGISEQSQAIRISPSADGWDVEVQCANGSKQVISALYIYNALGPWANQILEQSSIMPPFPGVNSKGVHLLVDDMGHKAGMFLETPDDHRMFFVLPWEGLTLIGTTETDYDGNPDAVGASDGDVQYLLKNCNTYLKNPVRERDIKACFAGLRWLAMEPGKGLGQISRSDIIGKLTSQRGQMYILYGGKLTTYRKLSEDLGNQITKHFGEVKPSKTAEKSKWVTKEEMPRFEASLLERFKLGGVAFSDASRQA